ncbi:MAG: gluconate 2-dehydrogenase subunit 3 family protein [Acidobacteriota bacterium]|nr:gluconate 2-dehydrogenase subunit 3 family protein [Acidobacteriota bacterium]
MKRRDFVRGISALPAAPALLGQQPVVPPKPVPRVIEETPKIEATVPDVAAEMVPQFFGSQQFSALLHLADTIAPAVKGTPGAADAHAAEFLDFLVGDSPADRQHLYRAGLDALDAQAKKQFGKSFADLDASQTDTVLAPLHRNWSSEPSADPLARFLDAAKADILTATVNSREWISVVSKRSRGAGGTGTYWYPID